MWAILKVFIEFVTILLLFYVLFFLGCKACGMLAPWPGIEPLPPCIGRLILNHWTTREFPWVHFFVHHSSLSHFLLYSTQMFPSLQVILLILVWLQLIEIIICALRKKPGEKQLVELDHSIQPWLHTWNLSTRVPPTLSASVHHFHISNVFKSHVQTCTESKRTVSHCFGLKNRELIFLASLLKLEEENNLGYPFGRERALSGNHFCLWDHLTSHGRKNQKYLSKEQGKKKTHSGTAMMGKPSPGQCWRQGAMVRDSSAAFPSSAWTFDPIVYSNYWNQQD